MERTGKKRGRPKLFPTKEMLEERKLLKRLCKNTRRKLQDNLQCGGSHVVAASTTAQSTGEASPQNYGGVVSDQYIAHNAPDEAPRIAGDGGSHCAGIYTLYDSCLSW